MTTGLHSESHGLAASEVERYTNALAPSMRSLIPVVLALSLTRTVVAQGLVNFSNDGNTLVYAQELVLGGGFSIMSGQRDSYYFALLLGTPNNFTFTGLYATNTGVNGLFSGGIVAVPGWAPGTRTNFVVAGWSAQYNGHDFQPFWLQQGAPGDFGYGGGPAIAGNGSTIPPPILFTGGGTMFLRNTLVPEPSAAALIALGAGVPLLYRRGKSRASNKAIDLLWSNYPDPKR